MEKKASQFFKNICNGKESNLKKFLKYFLGCIMGKQGPSKSFLFFSKRKLRKLELSSF